MFAAASRILPGGVDSPVRAFKAVGGTPLFIARAKGSSIEDVDGHTYIDFVMSWGPLIHGHAPRGLLKALSAAAARGTSFGAPTELETRLAQRVATLMPSMERVRFVSSGTEAAMSAIRVARAATKRDKIVKFEGCYHGHADAFLVQAGSGAMTLGVPTSPGVPAAAAADTILARYNDLASVEAAVDRHRHQIAAVIVEPIAGNIGVVPPARGIPRGTARPLRSARRAARLRRSDFRVPRRGRRRAAGVSRPPGSDLPRQDHRRRPAGRRVWRPRRPHGTGLAGGTRLSGRHAVGQPARDDRRPLVADGAVAEALSPPREARRAARGRPRGRGARGGRADAGQRLRFAGDAVLHERTGAGSAVRAQVGHGRVRQVLQRDAGAGRVSAAVAVRGVVPVGRSHGEETSRKR